MDRGSIGGQVQDWMDREFGDAGEIPRGEVLAHAQGAELPEEAMAALRQLPEGTRSRDDWVHEVVDILETRAGGGEHGLGIGPGSWHDR